jgi:hypothetical protein
MLMADRKVVERRGTLGSPRRRTIAPLGSYYLGCARYLGRGHEEAGKEAMVHRRSVGRIWLAAATLAVLGAACNSGGASSGGAASLKIASPADGTSVSEPFKLTFDASVPLGQPSTGDDHVHVCFDGASCDSGAYKIAYGDSYTVTGLSPGKHSIEASLRHADHSAVGPTATITVTITGGAGQTSSPSSSGGSKGYGY